MIENITPGMKVGVLGDDNLFHIVATVKTIGKKWITLTERTMCFHVDTQETHTGGTWGTRYRLVAIHDPELTRRRIETAIQQRVKDMRTLVAQVAARNIDVNTRLEVVRALESNATRITNLLHMLEENTNKKES